MMPKKDVYKIVIVSDSHGDTGAVRAALSKEQPIDMLIHCGDMEADLERALGEGRDYDLRMVRGNMDFGRSDLASFLVFDLAGHRFFVAHGDRYSVSFGNGAIAEAAGQYGADIVLYGHTHVPDLTQIPRKLTITNPGSVSRPRGGSERSYAVMKLSAGKMPDVVIKNLAGR